MFQDRITPWTDRLTLTIKPTWVCNLSCNYCYQGRTLDVRSKAVMSPEVMEAAIRAASELPVNTVDFQWIGGETLAPGIGFYQQALDLTKKHARPGGARMIHWFQTNLTLIDEKWIDFLSDNAEDLVLSVSYDFFEDYFTAIQTRGARTAHHQWLKIQRALDLLRANDIPFGCLTTISRSALETPAEVWFERFLAEDIRRIGLQLDYADVYAATDSAAAGHPWKPYIAFLDRLFTLQEAHNRAHPERPVILRESLYLYNKLIGARDDAWVGSCHHSPALCGQFFWTIDVDGEVHGMCDAFMTLEVAKKFRLGNVVSDGLESLKQTPVFEDLTERQFALKRSPDCRACPANRWCNGGCPAFKSHDNRLDSFTPTSVYCEFTRAFFGTFLTDEGRRRLAAIYDGIERDALPGQTGEEADPLPAPSLPAEAGLAPG